jgi:hypothetical protein
MGVAIESAGVTGWYRTAEVEENIRPPLSGAYFDHHE